MATGTTRHHSSGDVQALGAAPRMAAETRVSRVGLVLRFVDNEVLVLILLCDADHLSGRFDEMCLGSVSSVGAICSPHYQST